MSLSTLTAVKTHLGVSGTGEDSFLTQVLRGAAALIRSYVGQYLGGLISANTVANPTVVTSIGHGLQSGETINIAGSNCSPTIDGARVITWLTEDTFSVPVNVTSAGTAGSYARTYTEFYSGMGKRELVLDQRPIQSITSIYEDSDAAYGEASNAFESGDLLTAGEDYSLLRDNANQTEKSKSGIVLRIGSTWGGATARSAGMLCSRPVPGSGNIKVTYVAGYARIPADLQLACHTMVAQLRASAERGGALASESLDYYSYSRVSPADEAKALDSVKGILKKYKGWIW